MSFDFFLMFLLCFRLSGSEINDENNNATISMIVKRNVKLVITGYVGLSAFILSLVELHLTKKTGVSENLTSIVNL